MSAQDTGGPAFPAHVAADDRGMTLLDFFAYGAMREMLTDDRGDFEDDAALAEAAYNVAATMLAEKRRREAGEANP